MKINKFKFLKVLAKHLAKKIGASISSESELTIMATSLTPMFNCYIPKLMNKNIIDEDGRINIDAFKEETDNIFKFIPAFNFPMGTATISISKEDVDAFIKELSEHGEIDQVIYLPCQN